MNTAAVSPIPANYAALTRIDMLTGLMDKSSGEYRHACEVRWVISLGSMQAMKQRTCISDWVLVALNAELGMIYDE